MIQTLLILSLILTGSISSANEGYVDHIQTPQIIDPHEQKAEILLKMLSKVVKPNDFLANALKHYQNQNYHPGLATQIENAYEKLSPHGLFLSDFSLESIVKESEIALSKIGKLDDLEKAYAEKNLELNQ